MIFHYTKTIYALVLFSNVITLFSAKDDKTPFGQTVFFLNSLSAIAVAVALVLS